MKKILSLGLIVGLCISVVGCSKKMSVDEIEECSKTESHIEMYYSKTSITFESLMKRFKLALIGTGEVDIEGAEKDISELNECKIMIDELKLNDLKKYHDYMVEYKGSTQGEEDYKFIEKNYEYLTSKRLLAYTEEIESYLKDDELSTQELVNVKGLKKLWFGAISFDNDVVDEVLKTFQFDLDKKYGIDSQELYDIQQKMYSLSDNKEE